MTTLLQLEACCNELLESHRFTDASYNGIQVDTATPITRLATGVTASEALLRAAADAGAQAVLAHHGMFWVGQSPVLRGHLHRRVSALMQAGVGLLAYHLPLDAHPTLGNNAQLAAQLGLTDCVPWGDYKGAAIGIGGALDPPQDVAALVQRIEQLVGRAALHLPGGPDQVARVAVVSGGGAMMAMDAARHGYHLLLTGEPTESTMHFAAEEGVHVVAAGHHATERPGVRALGDHLAQQWGLQVVHLDIPNPV